MPSTWVAPSHVILTTDLYGRDSYYPILKVRDQKLMEVKGLAQVSAGSGTPRF